MRTIYQLKSEVLGTDLQFTFSQDGMLVGFLVVEDIQLNAQTVALMLENVLTLELLREYCHKRKLKLIEVPPDLSFKNFWNLYNYKEAGDKKDAEKKWDLLDDADRIKAIAYLKTYNAHQLKSGAARLYAKTYLNKKPWDNA